MDFFKKHILILLPVLILLAGSVSPVLTADPPSFVTEVIGETSLIRNGEDQGAGLGARVQSGDQFETGIASIMELSLNGRVGLRLLPLTKVVVLRLDTEEPQIQLLQGNVIGLTRESPQVFKVETPDADLRIQEGQFWARYEKEKAPSSTFSSLNGEARISPKNSSVLTLASKEAVDVTGGAALQSRWASPHELQAVKQAEDIEIQ